SSTRIRAGTKRTSWAPVHSSSRATRSANRSRACAIPTTTTPGCRTSTASTPSMRPSRRCAWMPSGRTARPASSAACRPRLANSSSRSGATRSSWQSSDWNCGNVITPNHKRKPFDDVRVRRALTLAIDQWYGAPALAKIATVNTVGGIVFPGSPLAATKAELEALAGYWPDIDKSRAEARRLLKEAGAEGLAFELLNRNIDQPYKFVGTWLIDEWSKIGLRVNQRVVPTGPWYEAMRSGSFDVVVEASCNSVVNPLLDVQKYLPHSVFSENYG